jgi:hypothetical protein
VRPYKITAVTETTIEADGTFSTDTIETGHIMAVLNRITGEAVVTSYASDAFYSQSESRCRHAG